MSWRQGQRQAGRPTFESSTQPVGSCNRAAAPSSDDPEERACGEVVTDPDAVGCGRGVATGLV